MMNKYRLLIVIIWISQIFSISSEEVDYLYYTDYTEVDGCANPNEHLDVSDGCHHSKFPKETLEQLYGPKVKQCCSSHGYTYIQNEKCEGREHQLNKLVCTSPNQNAPVLAKGYNDCPNHCLKDVSFKKDDFEINRSTGELTILKNQAIYQNITLNNYCLSYECNYDDEEYYYDEYNDEGDSGSEWSIVLKACLCMNSTKLDQLPYPKDLPKCCGKFPNGNSDKTCMGTQTLTETGLTCPGRLDKYMDFTFQNETYVQARNHNKNITIDKTDQFYCIGPTWKQTDVIENLSKDANFSDLFDMKLFHCTIPCNGKTPCIRTCCDPGKMGVDCSETISDSDYSTLASKLKINENDIQNHLYKPHGSERSCKKGNRQHLNPVDSCADSFHLKLGENQIILHHKSTWKDHSENEFCLLFEKDKTDLIIVGEICVDSVSAKFSFYPYILLVSCLFMLVTMLIYGFFKKQLLNHLTWIMINHTFTLMIAFFILVLNQIIFFKDISPGFCKFSGFALQYFFLASFALLTSMGLEVQMNMRGVRYSNRRMWYELGASYGTSLLISLITGIVEVSAPVCSEIAPHFGEKNCFFHGKSSKAIWFYLPMGISLSINAVNFVFIIYKHCSAKMKRQNNNLNSIDQGIDTSTMFTYIKLFGAMGFFWFFEIIGGLSNADEETFYVFDILNILQGFVIFVVHVCKPNVFNIIMNRINGKPFINQDDQGTELLSLVLSKE